MGFINKINTDDTKDSQLDSGELALDVFEDANEVYVGYENADGDKFNLMVNADKARRLKTPRKIYLQGEVVGNVETTFEADAVMDVELSGTVHKKLTVDSADNADNIIMLHDNEIEYWSNRNANDSSTGYLRTNYGDDNVTFDMSFFNKDNELAAQGLRLHKGGSLTYRDKVIMNGFGVVGNSEAISIFIDYENGSDVDGDGTEENPFKTMVKGASTVENIDIIAILLLSNNATHVNNERIIVRTTNLIIKTWYTDGSSNAQVQFNSYADDDYSYFYNVRTNALGSVRFKYLDFVGLSKTDGKDFKLNSCGAGLICQDSGSIAATVEFCTIDLKGLDNSTIVMAFQYGTAIKQISIAYCDIEIGDTESIYLITNRHSHASIAYAENGCNLDDGAKARRISGVLRNADGTPINIISNINFSDE